jgi:hypothetical protein
MKYTPGPWTYLRDYEFMNVVDSERNLIASARMGDQTRTIESEEREANARLIAAAPDLLEAAKDGLAIIEGVLGSVLKRSSEFESEDIFRATQLRTKIQRAIAKAEEEK